jgi:integrase
VSGIFGAGGVPITAVAARLHHADPGITQTVYAHRMKGAEHLAADAIGHLFGERQAGEASDGE